MHSSGALPVLAITGFRFLRISRRKPYILNPIGVRKQGLCGALSGASLGPSLGLSGAFLELLWGLPGGFSGASLAGFSDEPVSVLLVSASVASPGASLVSLGREA